MWHCPQWLETEFLAYLDEWERSVNGRPGFDDADKKVDVTEPGNFVGTSNHWLVHYTQCLILHILMSFSFFYTVHSFISLIRYIFTIPGVKVFLSSKICQDPVEKFFGCQRQRGGTHDNPTVAEFCQNTQALRVISSVCRASVRGNCRGNRSTSVVDGKENQPKKSGSISNFLFFSL